MNALIVAVIASLAVYASAAPSGLGAVVAGPAGVVTGHGAIGLGHGAILTAPVASAVVAGPALGLGWGGLGAIGLGHGGVVVRGPPTVPATIVGPSGAITATGLWGPTHGVHGW